SGVAPEVPGTSGLISCIPAIGSQRAGRDVLPCLTLPTMTSPSPDRPKLSEPELPAPFGISGTASTQRTITDWPELTALAPVPTMTDADVILSSLMPFATTDPATVSGDSGRRFPAPVPTSQ